MSQNSKHNTQFGKLGEDIAAEYLIKEKYTVLIRNYRYVKTEIDIICRKDNEIIFVEVKTRSSDMMAYPEKAVGKSKQKNIRLAAENYLEEHNLLLPARFDIIAIVKTDKKFEVPHDFALVFNSAIKSAVFLLVSNLVNSKRIGKPNCCAAAILC